MPDAMKIGGVSGWLRAAALADAAGMPVSSHLFPEVSAHLLAATPTAHWLEYVDWANPVLRSPLRIELGQAVVSNRPGTGIEWDEDAVAQYLAN
jgi:mandelate racemase